jgi:hypothetical protein
VHEDFVSKRISQRVRVVEAAWPSTRGSYVYVGEGSLRRLESREEMVRLSVQTGSFA